MPRLASAPAHNGLAIDRMPTPGEPEGSENLGDYLRCLLVIRDRNLDPAERERARDRLTNLYRSERQSWDSPQHRTLLAGTGSTGGFTIPRGFVRGMLASAAETAIVRPRATVVPIPEGLSAEVPLLNQATVPSAGRPAYFGGTSPRWIADGDTIPNAEPSFRSGDLEGRILGGLVVASRPLVMKSAEAFGVILERIFGEAVGWMEDQAFLLGKNPSEPVGIIPSQAAITTAARAGSGAISFADALKVRNSLLPSSRARAVWVASQAAADDMEAMTSAASSVFGRTTSHLDPNTGQLRQFLGRQELLVSEKLGALNTLGDFGLYDFSRYLIGDFMSMQVDVSDQYAFSSNLIYFRLIHMVGGLPLIPDVITLPDASTTVSPFVALGTA